MWPEAAGGLGHSYQVGLSGPSGDLPGAQGRGQAIFGRGHTLHTHHPKQFPVWLLFTGCPSRSFLPPSQTHFGFCPLVAHLDPSFLLPICVQAFGTGQGRGNMGPWCSWAQLYNRGIPLAVSCPFWVAAWSVKKSRSSGMNRCTQPPAACFPDRRLPPTFAGPLLYQPCFILTHTLSQAHHFPCNPQWHHQPSTVTLLGLRDLNSVEP